jgi:hypothetical protein
MELMASGKAACAHNVRAHHCKRKRCNACDAPEPRGAHAHAHGARAAWRLSQAAMVF